MRTSLRRQAWSAFLRARAAGYCSLGWRLRRSHLEPGRVRVAVITVHAVVRDRARAIFQTIDGQRDVGGGSRQVVVVIVPDENGDVSRPARRGRRCRPSSHAPIANLFERRALLLFTLTRSPDILPSIRKTLSTGLSMPFVARSRKPAKYGWSSNSKAQVTEPSRFTLQIR